MTSQPTGYLLKHGEIMLGMLIPDDFDWPWELCRFHPAPAYETFRHLFEHAHQLKAALDNESDTDNSVSDQWYAALEEIEQAGFHLEAQQSGQVIRLFTLHIDGTKAELKCYPE